MDAYIIEQLKRQRDQSTWEPIPLRIEYPFDLDLPVTEKKDREQEKEENTRRIIVIDL